MKNQVESKIEELIKELNLGIEISLEDVKEIILNEKDGNKEFNYLISVFVSKEPDINKANEIAKIVSEAWNTFPHKSIGGLSPEEVMKKSGDS